LFIKDDTCQPTGSFKDRASYLVAAFARSRGISEIVLASTGNAASSMAGVGAAAALKITVFLPKTAPIAKRVQVLQYGAELREVDGTYDQAFDESLEYSRKTGTLSRNTAYNPLTIEGKKSVSFEMVTDLARCLDGKPLATALKGGGESEPSAVRAVVPDHVFVPVGDGVILAGVYKGFEDLFRLGWVDRVPTLWACQAEGSSAIVRALGGTDFGDPVPSDTVADSISVDVPRNGYHALAKLRAHGGRGVTVSDGEILAAQRELASTAGLFAEPSSSAAWAGFIKVKGELKTDSRVVVLITGSGLKDIDGALRGL
jgi:threonine synthase